MVGKTLPWGLDWGLLSGGVHRVYLRVGVLQFLNGRRTMLGMRKTL